MSQQQLEFEQSKIEQLQQLPVKDRRKFLDSLTDNQSFNLLYDWKSHGRPKQLQGLYNDQWFVWLILAGRGFGKTRTGVETVRHYVETGVYGRIALVADNVSDARGVIVDGPSGLLATARPDFCPEWNPSLRKLTWPNGAVAFTYSSESFKSLRGPQHDFALVDELAKFKNQQETWDQLMFGLRVGNNPRVVVTTTPRPTKLIKKLIKNSNTLLTHGTSFENHNNIAPQALKLLKKQYEGTRIGRQELYAEVLDDNINSLFNFDDISNNRYRSVPDLKRIVVSIDPAVTANENSDHTGIIVSGITFNDHIYVLADKTMKGSPNEWCHKAVALYKHYQADAIVGEVNQGGDMIESLLRQVDRNIKYIGVRATRGKAIRAEPVAALYEQNRVHHPHDGSTILLEDQMTSFDPTLTTTADSPDRMDALVWGITELTQIGDQDHFLFVI